MDDIIPISLLPPANILTGVEIIPLVQDGQTRRTTTATLLSYIDSNVDTLYTSDGLVPNSTNRLLTLGSFSTIKFDGGKAFIELTPDTINQEAENYSVLVTDTSSIIGAFERSLDIEGLYGVKLNLGVLGDIVTPEIGQVLIASDVEGNLEWGNSSSSGNIDGGNASSVYLISQIIDGGNASS